MCWREWDLLQKIIINDLIIIVGYWKIFKNNKNMYSRETPYYETCVDYLSGKDAGEISKPLFGSSTLSDICLDPDSLFFVPTFG